MLIDAYDQYTHDDNEVVDIQPDGDADSQENVLRADDSKTFMAYTRSQANYLAQLRQ